MNRTSKRIPAKSFWLVFGGYMLYLLSYPMADTVFKIPTGVVLLILYFFCLREAQRRKPDGFWVDTAVFAAFALLATYVTTRLAELYPEPFLVVVIVVGSCVLTHFYHLAFRDAPEEKTR